MMRTLSAVAILLVAASAPLRAQNSSANAASAARSSATGIGIGTAISGQGGNATSGPSTVNINSTVPPVQTINSNVNSTGTLNTVASGTTTQRTVPTVFAPSLTSAGIESCQGSFSIGAGWIGTGLTGGSTVPDVPCNRRLFARQLYNFGQKASAMAMMCLDPDVYYVSKATCDQVLPQPPPQAQAAGYAGPGPIFGTPSYSNAAYQAPPPTPYATDGSILLIDGKTGLERLCNNYDEPHAKCLQWAYSHAAMAVPKKKPPVITARAPATTPKKTPAKLPAIITDPPPPAPATVNADKAN